MLKINGIKIKELREAKDLTQLYVATFIGVTTDTISRWENQHYQTIKRENALKLAEALEVPLPEILMVDDGGPTSAPEGKNEGAGYVFYLKYMLPVGLVILIVWTWMAVVPGPGSKIRAYRIMPQHVPPDQPFPVAIVVENPAGGSFSLLVKENLPKVALVERASPVFQSYDTQSGVLKWIASAKNQKVTFTYLARIKSVDIVGTGYQFAGQIFVQHARAKPIDIEGPNLIQISDFHWADINKDNRIDDEEILTVYDLFDAFEGVDILRSEVEDIWAGNGYHWDAKTGAYVISP